MKFRPGPFNIILLFFTLLGAGCQTNSLPKAKDASTLRIFVEARPDAADRTQPIVVFLDPPLKLTVEKEPILDETSVTEAKLLEGDGKFAIQLKFTTHGALVLETTGHARRGRHLAIYSEYPAGRWIGAPLLRQNMAGGELIFRMDGTRDDAERFVKGLNLLATAMQKRGEQY